METTTSTILQRLFKTNNIGRFLNRYGNEMSETPVFSEYISKLCADKNTVAERVIKKADIDRTYGHQLFNGTRTPSRDKVIQLAFGFGMDFEETQKLLTIAGKGVLYPKVKRDAVFIYAIENGYDVEAVQATLFELKLPVLGDER